MNKFQKLIASAKDNKVTIVKGAAVILGATAGLAIGMDLMSKAVDSGEEALEALGTDDENTDDSIVVISDETD